MLRCLQNLLETWLLSVYLAGVRRFKPVGQLLALPTGSPLQLIKRPETNIFHGM